MKMVFELVIGICCEERVRVFKKECGCSSGFKRVSWLNGKSELSERMARDN